MSVSSHAERTGGTGMRHLMALPVVVRARSLLDLLPALDSGIPTVERIAAPPCSAVALLFDTTQLPIFAANRTKTDGLFVVSKS
jgi:hypothetical protein